MRSQVFGKVLLDILINCLRNPEVFLQLFQGILFYVCHDVVNSLGARFLQLFADRVKVPSDLLLILNSHKLKLYKGVKKGFYRRGKSGVFVNTLDKGLKLFFELASRTFVIPTLFLALDIVKFGFITTPEDIVLEIDLINLTRYFVKAVHVELNNQMHTCLTKDPKLLCLK